jgi:AcrR family transcriptional regulator
MNQEKLNIIEKVSLRFLTQGAKTVTMDDVCSILGISKKTLYQFFPTKESLLAEMLSYISEKIMTEIISIQK